MTGKTLCAAAALVAGLAAFTTAQAQESEFLGENRDWRAYKVDTADGPLCWAATEPKPARDNAYLMVAVAPTASVTGEVSVRVGFPIDASAGSVSARIDSGRSFDFFAEGEDAWLESADLDPQMIAAMRRGVKAVVTARRVGGGSQSDTYSLYGFTAAYRQATGACR